MIASQTVPVIAVTRGDLAETIHRGAYVAVDSLGRQVVALGDPELRTYLRSSAKPFQALPVVLSGADKRFELSQRELAIAAGSHSGEPIHVDTVRSMLDKAGVPESALRCGPHLPIEQDAAYALIRRSAVASAVHSNCSGKHAGMLLAAQAGGNALDSYLDYGHPVQQAIQQAVSVLADTSVESLELSRDGCGAPIFALSLARTARLFAHLADPSKAPASMARALATVRDAMMAEPYLVAGKARLDVRLMETFPGKVVVKSGAAGVYGMGLPASGIGIAIKIESGDQTARTATAIQVLRAVAPDQFPEPELAALWDEFCPPILNLRGERIGEVRWLPG
ncbi:asparaginase [Candidatus Poribacteria bacterium]|nr:asparaginase [Candidatus Poribacteria bacterium]